MVMGSMQPLETLPWKSCFGHVSYHSSAYRVSDDVC